MAPKSSLSPWLADFLCAELEAVTTWKTEQNKRVKPDPESRFSDDGSNFRSIASPPEENEVQLIDVLSVGRVVTAIVSDGVTQLRAQLSDAAVAVFQEETGEELTLEVTGDVFHIKALTIITTILGPVDEFVQMAIDEIDYRHHLRRTFGQPKPIEEDENIRLLLANIKTLRIPQFKEELDEDSQPDTHLTSGLNGNHSSNSLRPVQSQVSAKRKRYGPTLGSDGFEIENGVNLEGPMQPLSKSPHTSAAKRPQIDYGKEKQDKLLGLLGGNLANEKATSAGRPPRTASIGNASTLNQLQSPIAATQQTHRIPGSSPHVSPRVATTPQTVRESASTVAETPLKPTESSQRPSSDVQRQLPAASQAPPSAQLQPQSKMTSLRQTSAQPHFRCGRCKVPPNQRNILDHASSWIPSLPGRRFPKPNVPIELLKKWNTEVAARTVPAPSQRTTATPSQPSPPASDASADFLDDDSDELLSESEWPASQSPEKKRRLELPPSSADAAPSQTDQLPSNSPRPPRIPNVNAQSTYGSVIHGTPQGDLEVAAPIPLPLRKSPNKPVGALQLPQNNMRYPLPPRPKFDASATGYEGLQPGQISLHSSAQSFHSIQGQRHSVDPTTGLGYDASPPHLNKSPASKSQRSPAPQLQSWPRTETQPSRPQNAFTSSADERKRRSHHFASAPPTGPRYDRLPEQLRSYMMMSQPSGPPPPSEASSRRGRSPFFQRPGSQMQPSPSTARDVKARTQQSSSWLPQEASTQLHVHQALQSSPSRALPPTVSATPEKIEAIPNPVHPAERHRLRRKQFMTHDRRGEWLKLNYKPDRNGHVKLVNIVAQYNHLHPADDKVTFDDFFELAGEVFPHERITPGIVFASIPNDKDISLQSPVATKSNPLANIMQIRADWLKKSYYPDRAGKLSLATIIATYKLRQGLDKDASDTAILEAARKAFDDTKITATTRYSKVLQPHSRPTSSAADLPSDVDGANDHIMHDDLDLRYGSQRTNGDSRHGQGAHEDSIEPEPIDAMKRFCEAYLETRPGNGNRNVFAEVQPQRTARKRIDVLGWEF